METNALRRAALVLAKLDRQARESVLARMPVDQAAGVRDELESLQSTDFDDQETAIQDFFAVRSNQTSMRAGIDSCNNDQFVNRQTHSVVASSSLHDLLKHADEAIATALLHERAPTIAALLSLLPGDRAAGVLKLIPPKPRAQVVAIWDQGINANSGVVDAIAEWICDHLAESNVEPIVGSHQHGALQAILDEFDPDEREEMLEDLARENPMLAKRLAQDHPASLNFTS